MPYRPTLTVAFLLVGLLNSVDFSANSIECAAGNLLLKPIRTVSEAVAWRSFWPNKTEVGQLYCSEDSNILVLANSTHISALSQETGEVKWVTPLNASCSVSIVGELNASVVLVLGTANESIVSTFEMCTGSITWFQHLPECCTTSPPQRLAPSSRQDQHGRSEEILFACGVEILVRVRADGNRLLPNITSYALPNGTISVALSDSGMKLYYVLNESNNVFVAACDVYNSCNSPQWLTPFVEIVGIEFKISLILAYDSLLVVSFSQFEDQTATRGTVAFNASTGRQVWSHGHDIGWVAVSWGTESDPIILVNDPSSNTVNLTAYDPATGDRKWAACVTGNYSMAVPTSSGFFVVTGSTAYYLDSVEGKQIWRMPLSVKGSLNYSAGQFALFLATEYEVTALYTCVEPSLNCEWDNQNADNFFSALSAVVGAFLGVALLVFFYIHLERTYSPRAQMSSVVPPTPRGEEMYIDQDFGQE